MKHNNYNLDNFNNLMISYINSPVHNIAIDILFTLRMCTFQIIQSYKTIGFDNIDISYVTNAFHKTDTINQLFIENVLLSKGFNTIEEWLNSLIPGMIEVIKSNRKRIDIVPPIFNLKDY